MTLGPIGASCTKVLLRIFQRFWELLQTLGQVLSSFLDYFVFLDALPESCGREHGASVP